MQSIQQADNAPELSTLKSIDQMIVGPDERGYWGPYGGRFVPETLMAPLNELLKAYDVARTDRDFQEQFATLLRQYSGRPTPLFFAARLTDFADGARIY